MSYNFYVVMHVTGIILTFVALGGAALHSLNGGTRETNRGRGLVAALHGTGLVLVFVGGFGLMARIGLMHGTPWPMWLIAKLVIWLLLGGAIVLLNRKAYSGRWLIVALPLLGVLAAYSAKFKPGGAVAQPAPAEAPAEGSGAAS